MRNSSESFKIASFNVNSIRARLEGVLAWLDLEKPDVLCLQETKVEDGKFPLQEFQRAGYNVVFTGQKRYNGVAIASVHRLQEVRTAADLEAGPAESRLIAADAGGITVVNVYVPNGRSPDHQQFSYKLEWLAGLRRFLEKHYRPESLLVLTGDFNVAPEPRDVYDPVRLYGQVMFHPDEHKALDMVRNWGLVDVYRNFHGESGHYTFWDYRSPVFLDRNLGWRIDHIWATRALADLGRRAWIDTGPRRGGRPSDHTYILAEFMYKVKG